MTARWNAEAQSHRNAAVGSSHRRWISSDPPSRAIWQLSVIRRRQERWGTFNNPVPSLLWNMHKDVPCNAPLTDQHSCLRPIIIHRLYSPLIIYSANRLLCNTWWAWDVAPPPWRTNQPCPTGSLVGETCSLLCLPVGLLQPVALVADNPKHGRQSCHFFVNHNDAEDICWQRRAINFARQLFCLMVLLIDSSDKNGMHCAQQCICSWLRKKTLLCLVGLVLKMSKRLKEKKIASCGCFLRNHVSPNCAVKQ